MPRGRIPQFDAAVDERFQSATTIVEVSDDDFAALLRGDAVLGGGLVPAPGGVQEPAVLERVRGHAARLRSQGYSGGHWMVVCGGEVVGLIGFKNVPSFRGEVEIGYGIAATRRRRGHAKAAVAAVLDAARRDPSIRAVLADTDTDNVVSQRVLRANGFEWAGTHVDPTDGELIRWRNVVAIEPGR